MYDRSLHNTMNRLEHNTIVYTLSSESSKRCSPTVEFTHDVYVDLFTDRKQKAEKIFEAGVVSHGSESAASKTVK